METGDIGVVFPDVIHHYQVFSSEVNEAVFINAPQMIFGRFENVLRNKAPQYPVVKVMLFRMKCTEQWNP